VNLLLLHPGDFTTSSEVTISDRRFEHLKKIIKADLGQIIDAGLLNGKCGAAKITAIDKKSATLSVTLNQNPPAPAPITLILALPRPLMLKRILQTVTALGIKEIHLLDSQRVEKSYWNSSDLAEAVIHHQFLLGLEQSRDTVLPEIYFHKHFKSFIERDLAVIIKNRHALLADIGEHPPCPGNVHHPTVLAVGPEGGFIADEIAVFINAGFHAVHIGARPLRVEAAVAALLGRLLPL
jgi:16S rRNA (uracil1498-N3)-methyltransferase